MNIKFLNTFRFSIIVAILHFLYINNSFAQDPNCINYWIEPVTNKKTCLGQDSPKPNNDLPKPNNDLPKPNISDNSSYYAKGKVIGSGDILGGGILEVKHGIAFWKEKNKQLRIIVSATNFSPQEVKQLISSGSVDIFSVDKLLSRHKQKGYGIIDITFKNNTTSFVRENIIQLNTNFRLVRPSSGEILFSSQSYSYSQGYKIEEEIQGFNLMKNGSTQTVTMNTRQTDEFFSISWDMAIKLKIN